MYDITDKEIIVLLIALCFGYKILKEVTEACIAWRIKPK